MTDTVVIVLIAIGVFALAVVIYFVRLFMDGRRLRRERKLAAWRRQVIQHEEAELYDAVQREALRRGTSIHGDSTHIYPPGGKPDKEGS